MSVKTRKRSFNLTLPFRGAGEIPERLLQFIWQFQYFSKAQLLTTTGENVEIIQPGQFNSNQGPDFLDAKIKIDNTTWAGHVELHIKTSDWYRHEHDKDVNYRNVILHVVWEDDAQGPEGISTFELKARVSKILLERYDELMNAGGFIPCQNSISLVPELVWEKWKERLLVERLVRKAANIEHCLLQCSYHWEEAFWWLLARNFGVKVNAETFEAMARSIPVNLLAKHKGQIHQLEAILFGQAGMLEENFTDHYPIMLQKEYQFYKRKYGLQPVRLPVFYLRMRPGNFPTIRLAQLAMLVHGSVHLFSTIKEASSVAEVKKWFDVTANDYWHYHYKLDEPSSFNKKKLGSAMVNNIIVNTLAPMLFAYGTYHHEDKWKEKSLQWLQDTAPETNTITKNFQQRGLDNKTGFDSQALLELKHQYCDRRKCLDCAAGNAILKS